MKTPSTPAARVAEFVRQARRLRDIDPAKFHSVHTDPASESGADLSLDDLDALVAAAARTEPAEDEQEELQARIVSSIRGRDGEAGAGSDAYVGTHHSGIGGDYLEINGNLDIQHLASDLLQDGYGQGVPKLHDAWEDGAESMMNYIGNQHAGIDPPANPYSAYKD